MKPSFPWIALFVAAGLTLAQLSPVELPLFTRLLMNEFGFILCLIGGGLAIRGLRGGGNHLLWLALIGCALFAAGFLYTGIALWPEGGLTGGS